MEGDNLPKTPERCFGRRTRSRDSQQERSTPERRFSQRLSSLESHHAGASSVENTPRKKNRMKSKTKRKTKNPGKIGSVLYKASYYINFRNTPNACTITNFIPKIFIKRCEPIIQRR